MCCKKILCEFYILKYYIKSKCKIYNINVIKVVYLVKYMFFVEIIDSKLNIGKLLFYMFYMVIIKILFYLYVKIDNLKLEKKNNDYIGLIKKIIM